MTEETIIDVGGQWFRYTGACQWGTLWEASCPTCGKLFQTHVPRRDGQFPAIGKIARRRCADHRSPGRRVGRVGT